MASVIKDNLYKLADKELSAANEKFPMFASLHEGYAVTLEEVQEAYTAAGDLTMILEHAWKKIKANGEPERIESVFETIYETSVELAEEAIQCAAMARKVILSSRQGRTVEHEEGNAGS